MSLGTRAGESDAAAPAMPTDRELRALDPAEHLLVNFDDPDAPLADEAVVYSADRAYFVNLDVGFCECPDKHYRCDPGEDCKHLARARFVRDGLPAWANPDAVDPWFGLLVDGVGADR